MILPFSYRLFHGTAHVKVPVICESKLSGRDYLAQKLFTIVRLMDRCQMALKVSSAEIDKIKSAVISLQGEKIASTKQVRAIAAPQSQIGALKYSEILQQQSEVKRVNQRSSNG